MKAVERGEISISRASEISRKPTSEQEYALAAIESEPKARSHRGANITRRKRRARAVDVGGRELVQTLRADLALAKCRVRELEEELALTKATSSAVPDPDSMDLPPSLDRRPLSPEDEDIVAVLTTCWANERQLRRADWENASAVVRHRFIKVLLED